MSRIYFHSPSGTAEVRGAERHWMGALCNGLFEIAANLHSEETQSSPSVYRAITVPGHYTLNSPAFVESLRLSLVTGFGESPLVLEGRHVNPFAVILNTAADMGNDAIKLCARIHGQCEIHTWVDGSNRTWLAGIIEDGRKKGVFRDGVGWESVIEMLRGRDDEPVVTSYSVTDEFPNSHIAEWTPPMVDDEPNYDAWYDLSHEDQWRLGMEGLRKIPNLEMRPDDWDDFYFEDGMNGFELYQAAVDAAKPKAA